MIFNEMARSLHYKSVTATWLSRPSESGKEAYMNRIALTAIGLILLMAVPAAAAPPAPARTIEAATDVLNGFAALPENCIPASLLADAYGVAIIPHVTKGGFLIGGRVGHGLIMTRDSNGAWSGVTFVELGGASFGLQAGVESADVVLVFKTRHSLDRILNGKGKLMLGADVAIAAGPVGRQAEAGTDARLRAEIVSYSRSRGLFAGVALDGAAMIYDRRTNAEYLRDPKPETARLTTNLLARLTQLSSPPLLPANVIIPEPILVPRSPMDPPIPPAPLPVSPPAPSPVIRQLPYSNR
jgi:lipid-binding SYLF domain-containing protein